MICSFEHIHHPVLVWPCIYLLWGFPPPKLQIKFHFFMYLCSGLNYNQALKLSTHPLMHWPINKKDHVKIIFACQQLKDLHQFYHTKSEERKNVLSFFTIYVPRHHELNYYSDACFFQIHYSTNYIILPNLELCLKNISLIFFEKDRVPRYVDTTIRCISFV